MKHRDSSRKGCVGLISAVPSEGTFFARKLRRLTARLTSGPNFYAGEIEGVKVVYSVSGMGKTNAAHAATILVRDYSPGLLINFGAGGAYPFTGLSLGDIMVAEAEIYGDEGVLDSDGFHGTEYMGIPVLRKGGKEYYNEFALDKRVAGEVVRTIGGAFEKLSGAPTVVSGKFVTLSTCTGTAERAAWLQNTWGAICENMEGAAIAHICALYKIPFVEIRGVSNIVRERDRAGWNIGLASGNCCKAVVEVLKTLKSS